jgi:sec-independent protein translocase protein TatA
MGLSTPRRSYETSGAESGNLRSSTPSACCLDTRALGLSRRELGLGSRPLEKTSEGACGLGSGTLGAKGKGLGLGPGALGLSLISKEFGVQSSETINLQQDKISCYLFSSEPRTKDSELEVQKMFGLGLQEIIIILVIFLLLFGAKRLPQIGEGLGKTIKELKKVREEKKPEKGRERNDQKGGLLSDLKKEVEEIPGLKEAKALKETADKVKSITRFLK